MAAAKSLLNMGTSNYTCGKKRRKPRWIAEMKKPSARLLLPDYLHSRMRDTSNAVGSGGPDIIDRDLGFALPISRRPVA